MQGMYTHKFVLMYAHRCVHMCMQAGKYYVLNMSECMDAHTHTHTHTHTQTHTQTHTHTNAHTHKSIHIGKLNW